MNQRTHTGREFGLAVIDHLGLDSSKVSADLYMRTGRDDVFGITLDIRLTADDVVQIGKLMRARAA